MHYVVMVVLFKAGCKQYPHFKDIAHYGKKNERLRRTLSHGVAALSAFGIEQGNPFRDFIDSLLIWLFNSTTYVNICFTFQQVLYFAAL